MRNRNMASSVAQVSIGEHLCIWVPLQRRCHMVPLLPPAFCCLSFLSRQWSVVAGSVGKEPPKKIFPILQKDTRTRLWTHDFVKRATSLQHLGSSQWHKGIRCRPQLTCGDEAAKLLREFFCTETGTKRSLNRVFAIKRKQILDPGILDVTL